MNQMLLHSMYSYTGIEEKYSCLFKVLESTAFCIGSGFTSVIELLLSLAFFPVHFLKGRAPVIFNEISYRI